jgi:hypothetical protein
MSRDDVVHYGCLVLKHFQSLFGNVSKDAPAGGDVQVHFAMRCKGDSVTLLKGFQYFFELILKEFRNSLQSAALE